MVLSDIPTETFNQIIADLCTEGWTKSAEYAGMDAWIDYGMVVLKRGRDFLKFEWDNWSEGSIEGSDTHVQAIKDRFLGNKQTE